MSESPPETASPPLRLGDRAPAFQDLLGADGRRYRLSSFDESDLVIVIFSCNGCPTVRAYEDRMAELQADYAGRKVQLVAINANNSFLSPADTYAEMVKRVSSKVFKFPYLKDDDGSVAKAYGALRTPHAFLLDRDRRLRYVGRIDDSRDPSKATQHDLRSAVDQLLGGDEVAVAETEPFGCTIVW